MSSNLYELRNALLNKATSYRGSNWEETKKVRVQCFIEAEGVTQQLEELWANQSHTPPVAYNLYDSEGHITHMMITSDGITHRYVKLANWLPEDYKIKRISPIERLRHHEMSASRDELNFKRDIKHLADTLGVTNA